MDKGKITRVFQQLDEAFTQTESLIKNDLWEKRYVMSMEGTLSAKEDSDLWKQRDDRLSNLSNAFTVVCAILNNIRGFKNG